MQIIHLNSLTARNTHLNKLLLSSFFMVNVNNKTDLTSTLPNIRWMIFSEQAQVIFNPTQMRYFFSCYTAKT